MLSSIYHDGASLIALAAAGAACRWESRLSHTCFPMLISLDDPRSLKITISSKDFVGATKGKVSGMSSSQIKMEDVPNKQVKGLSPGSNERQPRRSLCCLCQVARYTLSYIKVACVLAHHQSGTLVAPSAGTASSSSSASSLN